ncbi:cytochrome c oxidase subunit 3 [Flavobacteriaceae bacterium]|jgi:cytochrome c oxidase subunit 3|nr:cytochrome oxidase subunit III [Flavobacteriaceae bacterium]MBT4313058.1 cytochrome oxidase subunit III [Flavobacteriaceae bacterium]MBT5090889.1 cytochrome oxidase subunit III [Flavobacteriaceae bacterium]MBT5282806.1 cytochrome oxidase subunit III [Flavobacteriaceae bacterium]MBT5446128.1 cytochrome oxidase subunit III [Flavobacteriaceae bacterium]|tara:strand:- start:22670 stop:23650 length:981 start_codon:yes stop_codon:yes gene_type:complete
MEVTAKASVNESQLWGGGNKPLNASYGKMMMWFFIVSDALTFTGFLVSYGFSRFKNINSWPIADEVFTHFPFLHGVDAPMYYVALMTFVLIFSSVTMVLAVDAGHHMQKAKVTFYMLLTIIGGAIFVGSQAWEWKNFIKGEYGALETKGGQILQFVNAETGKRAAIQEFAVGIETDRTTHQSSNGIWYENETALPTVSLAGVKEGFVANTDLVIRTQQLDEKGQKTVLTREESLLKIEESMYVVEGANLIRNEYGNRLFADFFFFITGFHGFHVLSGVVINIIIFFNVILGTYERRGHYEMVEKVGLYWHFVDLVWVFVFTFFYLV